MKKTILIILIIGAMTVVAVTGYHIAKKIIKSYQAFEAESHFYDPENFFEDQKMIKFCYAAKGGDLIKMNNLLRQGADINVIGKNGMTLFLWTIRFSGIHNTDILKENFQWFVDRKADPTKVYHWKGNAYYTVFHTAAKSPDIFYLKTLLESGLIKDFDVELPESSTPTALSMAKAYNQFENFKVLLDYGVNINKKTGIDDTPLGMASGNLGWQFAHELLKRGANFNTNMRDGQSEIVRVIEDIVFRPSVSLNYRGVDWRQKCVEFLENHDVPKIHPDMPDDEKYIKENGKYQLYVLEKEDAKNGQWVKFEESSKYKPDKDNGVYIDEL